VPGLCRPIGPATLLTSTDRTEVGRIRRSAYCDDFVVMVTGDRQHAEELRMWVAAILAQVGLKLSPEKTQVVHIDEGFDFLGFHIRRMRKRGTQTHYVYTVPSKRSIQSIKEGARQDVQVNPAFEPARAADQPQPDSAGLGELLSVRSVQGRVRRGRQLRLAPHRKLARP
jgi:hypothetical protein